MILHFFGGEATVILSIALGKVINFIVMGLTRFGLTAGVFFLLVLLPQGRLDAS